MGDRICTSSEESRFPTLWLILVTETLCAWTNKNENLHEKTGFIGRRTYPIQVPSLPSRSSCEKKHSVVVLGYECSTRLGFSLEALDGSDAHLSLKYFLESKIESVPQISVLPQRELRSHQVIALYSGDNPPAWSSSSRQRSDLHHRS